MEILPPHVIQLVRDFCIAIPVGDTKPTRAVLLHLEESGFGAGPSRYRELDDAARYELSDCATRADEIERQMYGRLVKVRPWLWHAPDGFPRPRPTRSDKNAETWLARHHLILSRLDALDARLNEILRILTDNK